jgi:hypothetical protein
MTDLPASQYYRDQATHYRKMANGIGSIVGQRELTEVAQQYDEMAEQVGRSRHRSR